MNAVLQVAPEVGTAKRDPVDSTESVPLARCSPVSPAFAEPSLVLWRSRFRHRSRFCRARMDDGGRADPSHNLRSTTCGQPQSRYSGCDAELAMTCGIADLG
jgi:hypothetical protein